MGRLGLEYVLRQIPTWIRLIQRRSHGVCAMNRKNIGFGHKTAICTAGGGGWTVYIEKPLENPKDGKADSLVFCFSDLAEEEKMCINLGFLQDLVRTCALAPFNQLLGGSASRNAR